MRALMVRASHTLGRLLVLPLVLVVAVAPTRVWGGEDVVVAADTGRRLQPIARRFDGRWVAIDAARDVASSGAANRWIRWYTSGGSVPIRTARGAAADTCRALEIENPPLAPLASRNATYVGLAVTDDTTVGGVRRLTTGESEWIRIEPAIRQIFQEREREQRVSTQSLATFPVTIDAAYGSVGAGASRVYYVEASKRVPDTSNADSDDDPKGLLRIAVAAWLRDVAGRLVPLGSKGELQWEQVDERGNAPNHAGLAPLGILERGDERVWVMASVVGNRTRFVLYDLGATRVRTLLSAREGSC